MPASLRITYLKPINQRSHYILFSLYSHRIRCIRIRFALANSTLLEVSLFKISMRRGQDSKSCPKAFPRSLFARSEFRRSDSRHIPLLKAISNPMKGFSIACGGDRTRTCKGLRPLVLQTSALPFGAPLQIIPSFPVKLLFFLLPEDVLRTT